MCLSSSERSGPPGKLAGRHTDGYFVRFNFLLWRRSLNAVRVKRVANAENTISMSSMARSDTVRNRSVKIVPPIIPAMTG